MNDSVVELLLDLPRQRSWVLPALLRAQRRFGYVSADTIQVIAAHLRLSPSDVDGIASGYPELRRAPSAGAVVRVCDGLPCAMAGSNELRASLDHADSDWEIEIETAPCLFACALAPVVEVGADCLGRATVTSVLESLRGAGRS